MYIHYNLLLSGDYISAIRGCCPLKFLYALEIASAHPKGDEGTPEKFSRQNLKLGIKFSVLGSIISELVGVSS